MRSGGNRIESALRLLQTALTRVGIVAGTPPFFAYGARISSCTQGKENSLLPLNRLLQNPVVPTEAGIQSTKMQPI